MALISIKPYQFSSLVIPVSNLHTLTLPSIEVMMAFSLARLKGGTVSLQDKLEGRCKRKICFDVIEFKKT